MDTIQLASPQLADAGLAAEPGTTGDAAMSALEEGSVALDPPSVLGPLPRAAAEPTGAIRVQGKFFFAGGTKHFVKGVTYGPFAIGTHGAQFPERAIVERDFALMRNAGVNTLRVFTVPPLWLLDMADAEGLKVLVGLPWSQHVAFLDSPAGLAGSGAAVGAGVPAGAAGTFVFAWTDEWFTGGHLIEDWAFGLVDRDREPKPAFHEVAARYKGPLPPALPRYPRVSVVVCSYNAERTMEACLASLEMLDYPDYEVIVVNDGSTDHTLEIAERFPYCRIISQPNKGLSVARNVGAEAATGEIVAYTDSDCVADPDWLTYLVGKMEASNLVACGAPNFPPPEDSLVPAAVAVSPGGPTHVLISDEVAEHIAGCNMAFRRDALLELGGFDPTYRAAGDDVDICWRFQHAGYTIGFSAAALVWHFRRNTVKAYLNQQRAYGKAA